MFPQGFTFNLLAGKEKKTPRVVDVSGNVSSFTVSVSGSRILLLLSLEFLYYREYITYLTEMVAQTKRGGVVRSRNTGIA